MSDILIKGMGIPNYKPICIIIDPAGQARRYDLNNDKYADDELFEAVPVPPHGRCIDVDVLRQDWLENGENEYIYDTNAFLDSLDHAPTIIEAELPVHHGTFAATSEQEAIRYLTGEDET